jgi:hypothetical protein
MSDLHRMPLLGHDLPEIQAPHFARAKVTKGSQGWCWTHQCDPFRASWSLASYGRQDTAFWLAQSHMRSCG